MKELINTISGISTFSCALVEAGHFYADKPLASEQQVGVCVGMATIDSLQEMGLIATPCILIDDYNAEDKTSESNVTQIRQLGFSPEVIYREKSSQAKAIEILEQLKTSNKTKYRKNTGETYLKEGFIKLVKNDGKLTCALLDAALYVQKHQEYAGICVTVLADTPEYRTQQSYTKSILKAAAYSIPILNVYFSEEGSISVDFDY